MKNMKKLIIICISITLCITLFSTFTLNAAEQQANGIANNIEEITGTEDIIKSDGLTVNNIGCTTKGITTIPEESNEEVIIKDNKDQVGIKFLTSDNSDSYATKNGTIVYPNDEKATLAIQPVENGVRNIIYIKSYTEQKDYKFDITVPEGSKLVTSADYLGEEFDTEEVFVVNQENTITSIIAPPWAKDANGNDIETSYFVKGNTLTQSIDFNKDTAFPIVADPNFTKIAKCTAAICWVLASSCFAAAKIIKIKRYIKLLGGVSKAVKEIVAADSIINLQRSGGVLAALAAEIIGITAVREECF